MEASVGRARVIVIVRCISLVVVAVAVDESKRAVSFSTTARPLVVTGRKRHQSCALTRRAFASFSLRIVRPNADGHQSEQLIVSPACACVCELFSLSIAQQCHKCSFVSTVQAGDSLNSQHLLSGGHLKASSRSRRGGGFEFAPMSTKLRTVGHLSLLSASNWLNIVSVVACACPTPTPNPTRPRAFAKPPGNSRVEMNSCTLFEFPLILLLAGRAAV